MRVSGFAKTCHYRRPQPVVQSKHARHAHSRLSGERGEGLLSGPGLLNWDLSMHKNTPLAFLSEAGNLQFRAEFFNVLNRANLTSLITRRMATESSVRMCRLTAGGRPGHPVRAEGELLKHQMPGFLAGAFGRAPSSSLSCEDGRTNVTSTSIVISSSLRRDWAGSRRPIARPDEVKRPTRSCRALR